MVRNSALQKTLFYLTAVWVTHIVLRAFVLYRVDVYGNPFVGKPSWYIFHAVAIDVLWIVKWTLPIAGVIWLLDHLRKIVGVRILFGVMVFFHSFLLLSTVSDHEAYRYLGMHLSVSILKTYVNPASLLEVGNFYTADASVPNLPYVLFSLCVPFSLLGYKALFRLGGQKISSSVLLTGFLVLCIVSLSYLKLWGGGFREKRLKPFVEVMLADLRQYRVQPMEPAERRELARGFQSKWAEEEGDSSFIFPSLEYPYFKYSPYRYCAEQSDTASRRFCSEDSDGDGYAKRRDCDDEDGGIFPGAEDIPGNGVDEDCSGADRRPKNFLFIILESHRALNCGFLKSYGALWDGTPVLNEIAKQSHYWTRFTVNGLPTVGALMATHLSLVNHPRRHISTDFTTLNAVGFPEVLRKFGYRTHFFSAADPAWDGQTPWLAKWYRKFTYHKDREEDKLMFDHLAGWMRDSLVADQPFLITAISKTNHYPFNPVTGIPALPKGASLLDKMKASMTYTDQAVGSLLDQIRGEEWFSNTLVLIMADHGFPLNEHGSSQIGHGLYTESVWIPFLIYGDHPELGAVRARHQVASQMDIAPTLLDLAGIDIPNHYMGHSLVSNPHIPRHAMVVRGEEGMLASGNFQAHGALQGSPPERIPELFDIEGDRLERNNILKLKENLYNELMSQMRRAERLNTWLIESNGLSPKIP